MAKRDKRARALGDGGIAASGIAAGTGTAPGAGVAPLATPANGTTPPLETPAAAPTAPPSQEASRDNMDAGELSPPAAKSGRSKSQPTYIGREPLDRFLSLARDGFVVMADMGAAFNFAARQFKDEVTIEDTPRGREVRLKPLTPFQRYARDWQARHGIGNRLPPLPRAHQRPSREIGARGESDDVAAKRRAWDEAARSGDPDRMTRTANDLIRAVEAEEARVGPHEAAHAYPDDGRHATSRILAPDQGPKGREIHVPRGSERPPSPNAANGGKPHIAIDPITGAPRELPQANAEAGPGQVATEKGAQGAESDMANEGASHSPPSSASGQLSQQWERFAADERMEALPDGDDPDAAGSIQAITDPLLSDGKSTDITFSDDSRLTGKGTREAPQPALMPLSYREQPQHDYDRSGGNIGQDFDDAIDRYFGSGLIPVGADRAVPMGRIALEKTLGRSLTPVEVEALQATRVLGRRLRPAERVELLSRNVIRGRLAEAAAKRFFEKWGFKVWAQNATIVTKEGIRRIDLVVRDSSGRYWAIETKAGGAARNAYQTRVDLEIQRNGGVFVGERAQALDGVRLRMGTLVLQIPGI